MEIEDMIKNFSDEYFGEKICWDTEKFYLYFEKLSDKKTKYCSHPKTYKLLSQSLRNVYKLVKDSKTIKADELLKWDENAEYCYGNSYDMFKCAYQNVEWQWIWFRNIMQNELMYYNMFLSFFLFNQWINLELQEFNIGDVSEVLKYKNIEMEYAKKDIELSQKAVLHMDRMLRNIYATFPIHIWLIAYYEDVVNFRKNFVRLYTPIHQINYKFRNVQDKRR
jgi:hypothetical protein